MTIEFKLTEADINILKSSVKPGSVWFSKVLTARLYHDYEQQKKLIRELASWVDHPDSCALYQDDLCDCGVEESLALIPPGWLEEKA